MLNHVGLLFNGRPGSAGLPFIKSSENLDRSRRRAYSNPAHYHYSILHRRADGCRIPEKHVVLLLGAQYPALQVNGAEGFAFGCLGVSAKQGPSR